MLKKKIAKLIDVKSITTLSVVFVFCYLNMIGKVIPDNFMQIFTVIIAFYFGTQTQKKEQQQEQGEKDNEQR